MILNDEQKFIIDKAVDWFYNSSQQIFQYDGPPGSGKSVVLNEIVRKIGLDMMTEVAPMSFIGAASLVMRTKGLFTARTAHSWIYDIYKVPMKSSNGDIIKDSNGNPYFTFSFKPKDHLDKSIKLIIIDEAYCMPLSMRNSILKFGIKVLACGDQNQLPPVKDKPAFLNDNNIYHLTQVMRQIGIEDILFIANRAMRQLPLLNGYYGNSLVIDRYQLTDQMLLWADVVITGTNATRDKINNHIRYLKGHNSLLPEYGERLVCRNNNWDLETVDNGVKINLVNGMIGTVINQPSISNYNSKDNTFTLSFLPDLVNTPFTCDANFDYMVCDHNIRSILKQAFEERGQMFEYAYAITCHISQGSQFHKVIYIEESMGGNIQSCLNLVGTTRADQQLIYVKNNYQPWINYNDNSYIDNIPKGSSFKKRIDKILKRYNNSSYKK